MTALIAALALIVGFQLGAGWVIDRGYGPFLWGFTHPFDRQTLTDIQDELSRYRIDCQPENKESKGVNDVRYR